ncbi:MAG: hypothetical protein R3B38_00090 [Patescibacteria group bacterium]
MADSDLLHYATCFKLIMTYSNIDTPFRVVEMAEDKFMAAQWEWHIALSRPQVIKFKIDGFKFSQRRNGGDWKNSLIKLNTPIEDMSVVGVIINKPWRESSSNLVGVGLIGMPYSTDKGELVSNIHYAYAAKPVSRSLEDVGQWLVDRTSVLLDYK